MFLRGDSRKQTPLLRFNTLSKKLLFVPLLLLLFIPLFLISFLHPFFSVPVPLTPTHPTTYTLAAAYV